MAWNKYASNMDSIIEIAYPISFNAIFALLITLVSDYNYINNAAASQVWIQSYNVTSAKIGNDWGYGYVFCLMIGN